MDIEDSKERNETEQQSLFLQEEGKKEVNEEIPRKLDIDDILNGNNDSRLVSNQKQTYARRRGSKTHQVVRINLHIR